MIKRKDGSITVFLTLILLLILSLVMTILEGARVSVAQVFAERALITSMDSLLAEYYRPLFDEYHIFALDLGDGSYREKDENLKAKMTNYMNYTFYPSNKGAELYDIQVNDILIKDWTSLMDQEGEIFIDQAAEYMKYKEVEKLGEKLLESLSLLEEPQKLAIIYEEKLKVEEELLDVDESILDLMNHLDGLVTSKKGLKVNRDGSIRVSPVFVKKICMSPISQESVGINNKQIFLALRGKYINPILDFNKIDYNFTRIDQIRQNISSLSWDYNNTKKKIALEDNNLFQLQAIEEKTDKDKKAIKDCKDQIKKLEKTCQRLESSRRGYERDIEQYKSEILSTKRTLSDWSAAISVSISSAISSIDLIIEKLNKAGPLISDYGDFLEREKKGLSKDLSEGLEEDYQELKKYSPDNKEGYDFIKMKQILETNKDLLLSVQSNLTRGESKLKEGSYSEARNSFILGKDAMSMYKIEGLELDYSHLVINKEMDKDFVGTVSSLVRDGVMALIIDPDKLSSGELPTSNLPSEIEALRQGEEAFDFSNLFTRDIGLLFTRIRTDNILEQALESFLFQQYLQEHFYKFSMDEEEAKRRKPTVLSYELEYLIGGHYKDKENISSVISKIVLLRTILNFTSILGNKEKVSEAKLIATALVGFTGLAVLVTITQTILMIILSFAEALVDTCALLLGKEVAIIKKNIALDYKDIFLLNNSFIKSKAEEVPNKAKELSLLYNGYLRIFLLLTDKKDLSYRGMDLIQENIQIRYEDSFLIQNCLYNLQAEAKFIIKARFTNISYIRDIVSGVNEEFNYKTGYLYSY